MTACQQLEPISFADIYDVLYDDPAFRAAQIAYLDRIFGPPPARVLDAGCGTGSHLLRLRTVGYDVVGLDADLRMARIAHGKLVAAGQPARLIHGDLRFLPFEKAFDGILCLESPLAYLLADDDLAAALTGFHRSLRRGGWLVIDVFDYLETLGEAGRQEQTTHFQARGGRVTVQEAHSYDRSSGIWSMRQAFKISRGRRVERFAVEHRLCMRSTDSYAAAIEKAGFTILECRSAYPETPLSLADERRAILVARCLTAA